jgi:G-protein coupled receptor 98
LLCSEFEESIEILLVGATGGAVLGHHLVSKMIIAESDSPFSILRFLNQSKISIPNPNSTMILSFVMECAGGLLGDIQVELFFLCFYFIFKNIVLLSCNDYK